MNFNENTGPKKFGYAGEANIYFITTMFQEITVAVKQQVMTVVFRNIYGIIKIKKILC